MDRTLNITNGDVAAKLLEKGGIKGDILPWRDVLHDGPVPEMSSLAELSRIRTDFIAGCGWGNFSAVQQWFQWRDRVLESLATFDRVVLWFEHDLYDQLQILQILDQIAAMNVKQVAVSMVCSDQYLGTFTPEDIVNQLEIGEPVTENQLEIAVRAWSAFCAESPESWKNLLHQDTSALPFLHDAVIRLLEEYPSCANGLSRTQWQALNLIAEGEMQAGKLFVGNQKLESRIFMGDFSFYLRLRMLMQSDAPLIYPLDGGAETISAKQRLALTDLGREVLQGRKNWLDQNTQEWWIGGVHQSTHNRWCWDGEHQKVLKFGSDTSTLL